MRSAVAVVLLVGCCCPAGEHRNPFGPRVRRAPIAVTQRDAGRLAPRRVDAGPLPDAGAPPLVPVRSRVRRNSAGTSELTITVRNDTRRAIDGIYFGAECYDNFNARILPRYDRDPSVYLGTSDARVAPRQTRSIGTWSMFDFDGCTKAIVTISSVHFVDDTRWTGAVRQVEDPREAPDQ